MKMNQTEFYKNISSKKIKAVLELLEASASDKVYGLEETCLEVKVGDESLYFSLDHVKEVIALKDLSLHPIECDNPQIRGLVFIKGQWLPVLHYAWCQCELGDRCTKPLCKSLLVLTYDKASFCVVVKAVVGLKSKETVGDLVDLKALYKRSMA